MYTNMCQGSFCFSKPRPSTFRVEGQVSRGFGLTAEVSGFSSAAKSTGHGFKV